MRTAHLSSSHREKIRSIDHATPLCRTGVEASKREKLSSYHIYIEEIMYNILYEWLFVRE
jgi:hypothetical protein